MSDAAEAAYEYHYFGDEPTARRTAVLVCCVLVFLCQYCQASPMIAPFLAASEPGLLVGTDMVGVIFAAYPMATALATPLPDQLIARIGIRATVIIGLCMTASGSLIFGLVGELLSQDGSATLVASGLILARALGGVGASLSESGCLTAVSVSGWGDDLGKAFAVVEVTTGVGAAVGAAMGGYLYYIGESAWCGPFMLPMLVASAFPLCVVPCVLLNLSDVAAAEELNGGGGGGGMRGGCSGDGSGGGRGGGSGDGGAAHAASTAGAAGTPGMKGAPDASSRSMIGLTCTALSLALSAAFFEGLNPLLEPHFVLPPFSLSIPQVGLYLAIICFLYTLTSLPAGWLTDKLNHGPAAGRNVRGLMLAGWAIALVGVMLLWPAAGAPLGSNGAAHAGTHSGYPNMGGAHMGSSEAEHVSRPASAMSDELVQLLTVLSVPALGISAALILIPSMADLQRGLAPDDEQGRARMCALWNGAYSSGSALGPLAATMVYARCGWPVIVSATAATAVFAGVVLLIPLLAEGARCRE
jgi:MFS family permease